MKRFIANTAARLARNSLVRNSAALITGTVASQVILFLCSPLLSRTFSLADFGNLANYNAWVTVLALLSCLRYEHAIIIARDRPAMNRVIALTIALCAASMVLYAAAAWGIYAFFSGAGYLARIRGFVLLIPVGILPLCIFSPLSQLNVRLGQFRRLATVATAQVIVTVATQLVLGVRHIEGGLIFGAIAGSATAAVSLGILTLDRTLMRELRAEMRVAQLLKTAAEHIHFPRYTLTADAINLVSQQFVPVLILALFDPALAGLYAFSMRIIRAPLIVVAGAAQNALRKEGVDYLETPGGLKAIFVTTTKGLFAIGLIPFVLMLLFAKPIFTIVFGQQWVAAGHVVQILSPGILFEFVAFPLTVFFLLTNTQYFTLLTQTLGFVALLASFLVGKFYFHSFIATCCMVSASMAFVNIATFVLARRVADRQAPMIGDSVNALNPAARLVDATAD
ncbi:MAG TPA: oligosaccharide flippase family protein [Gemmatimonadaceae bacterium]|jgi:O-antigen/teichoic acid export membrane protein